MFYPGHFSAENNNFWTEFIIVAHDASIIGGENT